MFFIDGAEGRTSINGTGMEDYFGSGWMFREEYNYPFIGYSHQGNKDWTGTHVMYRFHIADPIYFNRSIIAGIEHGHANQRQDGYTSVAFWYQTEPHEKLDPLPPLTRQTSSSRSGAFRPFHAIFPIRIRESNGRITMKLGVSAFAWTAKFDRSHLRLVPLVKEMGFSGFEIAMFDPLDLAVNDIRRAFETSDLECTVCAILPPGINPISPDDRGQEKFCAAPGQHCIETTSALGAKLLGGPLYAPIGYLPEHRPTKDEWSWAVEAFQSVCDSSRFV